MAFNLTLLKGTADVLQNMGIGSARAQCPVDKKFFRHRIALVAKMVTY